MNKFVRILYVFLFHVLGGFVYVDVAFLVTFQTVGYIHISHISTFAQDYLSRPDTAFIDFFQSVMVAFVIYCIIQQFNNLILIEAVCQARAPAKITPFLIVSQSELHTLVFDIAGLRIHSSIDSRSR